ncbi:AIPR family protein [Morganella morganii]|uniref:AIPR family protein n=1 Tax=Morganella morganii TaxID=582 RepID=UPI001646C12A|nr:AIPR family protein [Morganella morganii]
MDKKYTCFEDSHFVSALKNRDDLAIFEENKGAVFALELFFGLDDVLNTVSSSITGGHDDAKIDILFVSRELKSIVMIQAYEAQTFKPSAKGNKGADLAYAIGALLSSGIDDIPVQIKPQVEDARDALLSGEIENIYVWYVHNCPENEQIKQQMEPILKPMLDLLKNYNNEKLNINASVREMGLDSLDELYKSSTQSIIISDSITFTEKRIGFLKKDSDWESFVTTITGKWLADIYKKYNSTELFSANVRNFMGANKKDNDKIINAGIQRSSEESPNDFFVFNNGITALVHDFNIVEDGKQKYINGIKGISIVNGAQTTGSLGTLKKEVNLNGIEIGIRFIKCENKKLIEEITRYNNSQNKVIQSDFRANDPIQKRLRNEFSKSKSGHYDGGLRGVHCSNKRLKIDAHTAAQALMAWHGSPYDSYHNKMKIWEDDDLYQKVFNQSISSKHILFIYSLLEACNILQEELKNKDKKMKIKEHEKNFLLFLNERGSSFLIIHAIKKVLEVMLENSIKSPYGIGFKDSTSRVNCISLWKEILLTSSFQLQGLKSGLKNRLSNQTAIKDACDRFEAIFGTTFMMSIQKDGINPYSNFTKSIINKL